MKTRRILPTCLLSAGVLLTSACTTGDGYTSASYTGVYGNYAYPYANYGYGSCCYRDYDRDPERREKVEERRENPPDRSQLQSANTRSQSIGRPSSASMSRPARAPRGGGRRR